MRIREEGAFDRRRRDVLGYALTFLTLLIVLVHATQVSVNLLGAKRGTSLSLGLVDILIWAAIGLWFVRRIVRFDIAWPPISWAGILGTIWLFLSSITFLKGAAGQDISVSFKQGAVKAVQFAEYFVVAYLLIAETGASRKWGGRIVTALAAAVAVATAVGVFQYFSRDVLVLNIRGTWFENRNTFGAFLALSIPFLAGVAAYSRSLRLRLGMGILTLAALTVCLSGGAFLALCVGLLTVAALRGLVRFGALSVTLIVLAVFVLPHLPRENSRVLLDSVLLYREGDPYHAAHHDIVAQKIKPASDEKLALLPERLRNGEPLSLADMPRERDSMWKWRQACLEWQAGLNMAAAYPIFGVGAGSYQKNVNRFYDMPKYHENLLEPDTLSGYMIWTATAGLPFLAIMLWIFLRAGRKAAAVLFVESDAFRCGLAAGILGSLAALAVLCGFTNPLVRGVGVTMILAPALAESLRRIAPMEARERSV